MAYRRRRWVRVAAGVASLLLVLFAILGINTWRFSSRQITVPAAEPIAISPRAAVDRLAGAIRIPTISHTNRARIDRESFQRLHAYLEEQFPRVHERLTRLTGEALGDAENLSLLYQWDGTASGQEDAILLMAHLDTVPVEAAAMDQWSHPPLAGHTDDSFVWGRGTLDAKHGALAILEAVEYLLGEGFQPRQTIFIAMGHDEETGGRYGNLQIAEWMRRQGVRLEFVLDEGGCIYESFPGTDRPVALVGVAEKGYASVTMTARLDEGGHASMPPAQTAIAVLAEALHRLQQDPFPRRLDGGAGRMLDYVGPEMPWPNRIAVSNRWLFAPLVRRQMGATPAGDASLRTTVAPTLISGGEVENILPTQAQVTLNVRPLPGDRVEEVLSRIRAVVDDERVTVEVAPGAKEASRLSRTESPAFATIHRATKAVFPDVVVAPFVLVGATDASHYDDPTLSRDVYRFIPARLDADDLQRIHGVDERISREGYLKIVQFYVRLIQEAAALPK